MLYAKVLPVEDIQHRFNLFGVDVPWLENPAFFSANHTPDGRAKVTQEHQDLEYLGPVLHGFLPPVGGEILLAGARRILCQRPKLP